MTLSLYEISIPALIRGLENLSLQIGKAADFARENDIDESKLVHARLAPDMLDFAGQVQRASDTAKFGGARLSQGQAPGFADEETTLGELQARVARTLDYLHSIAAADIDGGEQRVVGFKAGQRELRFTAQDYARSFLLPNLYFHLTTAYGILRHKGVPLGKLDYLGKVQ